MDALQRMVASASTATPVPIRIKPGASNTLQVPAGTGDAAVGVIVDGHWRWNEAAAEQAGSGSAGLRDVWACAAASDYEAGSPGETDETDRSFVLRVTAAGADAPDGFAHTRKIAQAVWDGTSFTDVAPVVAGVVVTPGQTGDVKATARATAPIGWLLCDGAAVSRSTYSPLFAAIGTTYGAGDGSTTFNLPDLRGRVPVGVDGAAARLTANDTLGAAGGEEKHALLIGETPAHTHGDGGTLHASGLEWQPRSGGVQANAANDYHSQPGVTAVDGWSADVAVQSSVLGTTGSAGGGGSHNTMQPYQVVNWLIKL